MEEASGKDHKFYRKRRIRLTFGRFLSLCKRCLLHGFAGNNLEKITISAWYYRDSSGDRFDISQSNDDNQNRIKLIRHNNGKIYGVFQSGSSTSYATFNDASTGWIHLTLVYDGSESDNADRLKLYINGKIFGIVNCELVE